MLESHWCSSTMHATSSSARRSGRPVPQVSALTLSTCKHCLALALPHTWESHWRGTFEQLSTKQKPAPAFRSRALSWGHRDRVLLRTMRLWVQFWMLQSMLQQNAKQQQDFLQECQEEAELWLSSDLFYFQQNPNLSETTTFPKGK